MPNLLNYHTKNKKTITVLILHIGKQAWSNTDLAKKIRKKEAKFKLYASLLERVNEARDMGNWVKETASKLESQAPK